MGTLFDQPKRDFRHIDIDQMQELIELLQSIQKKTGLTFEEVLKVYELLQLRRKIDLYVDDKNKKDEQLKGFGELSEQFIDVFEEKKTLDIILKISKKDNKKAKE